VGNIKNQVLDEIDAAAGMISHFSNSYGKI
jgi:hypothetical protein